MWYLVQSLPCVGCRLVEAIDVGGFVGSSMLFFGGLSGPETSLQSAVERGGVVG
jgi:hypothetical protein